MLRLLVLLLLLANVGWFAWTRGWLPAGWLPTPTDVLQREPQRLDRQVRPEAISLWPAGSAPPVDDLAPATSAVCLQARPDPSAWADAVAAVEAAGVAPQAWQRVAAAGTADTPAGSDWLRVPEADDATAQRLRALAGIGLAFQPCP